MNPYMPYTPYMSQDAYMQDQMALRQRIDNLSQAQQQYKAQPQPNVNWIQVAGIDGARNQIVQPGTTAWMMDNNAPYFYVKYWQISQVSQTNNIIDAVRPTPKPAYMSCSPYFAYNAFGNGCCASGNVM